MARLQDSVVESIFETAPNLIMHGGTAIWRCYSGNRFSDDVDFYATKSDIKQLLWHLTWALSKRGIKMDYPRTGWVIYAFNEFAKVKLEAMEKPKNIKSIQKEYERADGSKTIVNTLSIEKFIDEKIYTYSRRRFIRDFYDLYHLCSLEKPNEKTKIKLSKFIKIVKEPIDEAKLESLVYTGVAPSFNTMKEYIRARIK